MREKKLSYKEASKIHRVSTALVGNLVRASKKKPDFIKKSRDKEDMRRKKLRVVIDLSMKTITAADGLLNAQQIQESAMQDYGMKIRNQYIADVLRNDLGARFKRVKKVPFLGNTDRCLILRA